MLLGYFADVPSSQVLDRLRIVCGSSSDGGTAVTASKIFPEDTATLSRLSTIKRAVEEPVDGSLISGILGALMLKSDQVDHGVSKRTQKPFCRSEIRLADGSGAVCSLSLWNSHAALCQQLEVGDILLLESK